MWRVLDEGWARQNQPLLLDAEAEAEAEAWLLPPALEEAEDWAVADELPEPPQRPQVAAQ